MFQAYMRGWRRWAAGLVLVPGLSTLGADALGLTSKAAGQYGQSTTNSRAAEAKDLKRRANEAYDAKNYGLARELAEKARALETDARAYEEPADGPVTRTTSLKPAGKPTSTDPKVLTVMAKSALDAGDLDKAQDLAKQAQAQSAGVRWGLFDDTPASILKDVQKARGREDRDVAAKLLADARHLYETPAKSKSERATNLNAAEEKAKQAASMHNSYSMWDFGDRPAQLIADVRKAREKERLVTVRPPEDLDEPAPVRTAKAPRKPMITEETVEAPRGDSAARKKQAVVLMQEGRALTVSRNYVEARKKYSEAARLNADFDRDESSPESELERLNVAAQRKINALVNEARTCIDLKDQIAATANLDEADHLAKGMGLDASSIMEVRSINSPPKPPAPIVRNGYKAVDGTKPASDVPMPIIRTARRDDASENGLKTVAGEETPFDVIPPVKPPENIIKEIPPSKKIVPELPPVPVPDIDTQAEAVKPPKVGERIKPSSEHGDKMLESARIEMKKGDLEAARKLAIDLINGQYENKDEAQALLKSIDTKEAEGKIESARRVFTNGMKAYDSHQYAQALAIFKQIDGSLLPSDARKNLAEMVKVASAKKIEMDEATASTKSEKLPTAPKPAAGLPDLPPPMPIVKNGQDNLLKQQEALAQVEFQRLRSKGLKVESEATNRFGKGETDAALQDMSNYVAEVKNSNLEPSKQNLLVRPIEARMDRLRILKHQTDFLTKENQDRRNFHAGMTQEALAKQVKQDDVAKIMKSAHKLMDEAKYKEAYVEIQKAQMIDPDDPSINANMQMAQRMYRMAENRRVDSSQEELRWSQMNGLHEYPKVNDKDPVRFPDDPEALDRFRKRDPRGSGSIGIMRSRSEKEKEIERKMSTPISVNFKNVPLEGAIEQLHSMTNINFDLDFRGLKEGNVDPKHPITSSLKDVSLKSALTIICQQAGLKHVIENETIRISTPKGTSGRQMVRSMPVGDLVIPAPNFGGDHLSNTDTFRKIRDSALSPSLRSAPAGSGLPTAGSPGSTLDLQGGRLTSSPAGPRDGGITTGSTNGSLERELIRLITTTIKPDSWMQSGGEGTIEYFPLGLAMVINQSPEVIEEVERLLESLRKLQDLEVSIEVKVVSLAETFYERIGVDFSMGIPTNGKPVGGPSTGTTLTGINQRNLGGNVIGLQVPGVPTPDLDIPIRATSFGRAVPPFGGFGNSFNDGGISLGLAFLSDIQVQMFLEAAQGDTRTNVMQAPKLTALNGTSASMTVGDFQFFLTGIQVAQVAGQLVFIPQNVPFAVGITQPIPPNASIQNGLVNFTPTQPQTPGLGLFIQPVVSADRRFVRLNIQQSFTNLISGTQQIPVTTIITPQFENGGTGQPVPFTQYLQQPRFSNLETQTVVVVPDGGTVVMGGLKYMTEGRNEFGPPVLSKIPYLNRLFKNVAYGREGRSILIMVTPRVIINREEQERQTGVRDDDFVGVGPG